jgi:acyl-CoA hydrolase/RimJ/RimL family protein N-acetyltransferase
MGATSTWADQYLEKKCTAQQAIDAIRPGQRVFIGSCCGEPQHLVRELSEAADRLQDIEVIRLLSLETTPLTLIANKSQDSLNIRSFYLGSTRSQSLARNRRFITPMNLFAIPRLFKSRLLPVHVALVQASPADDFGWMSLGVSVDVTLAAATSADLVIVQVNSKMPRVLGRSFIHVNDVDMIVEYDEGLLTVGTIPELESANTIGKIINRLIDDGSTLQISAGTTSQAILWALDNKNDLGVHTQYMTDDIMHLYSKGVITNRYKGLNDWKLIASTAMGTRELYEFLHDNPAIEFHPSDYVNSPDIISRHNKMVAMNVILAMDLTGQVAADAVAHDLFTGVTGMPDFIRGSFMSPGGKSIFLLPSTNVKGTKSRVVPTLDSSSVVVPRGDVQFVATEYGFVNLFGKSLQERAVAMISIAHPDFRDELFYEAKKLGLLSDRKIVTESLQGIYPYHLEEIIEIAGQTVTVRPAKPVDARRIQEHFYNLDKNDIALRFFHEKNRFELKEVEDLSQIDYVKNLTMIALIGEVGFGTVIGIGEYLLDETKNMAEIAFSIDKAFQGMGLGKIILNKMAEAAEKNGIAGIFAFTETQNEAMIRLFETLPCAVETSFDGDIMTLSCRFETLVS